MAVSPRNAGLGSAVDYCWMRLHWRSVSAPGLCSWGATATAKRRASDESVGFRHVPAESIPDMPYVRANVFMDLPL